MQPQVEPILTGAGKHPPASPDEAATTSQSGKNGELTAISPSRSPSEPAVVEEIEPSVDSPEASADNLSVAGEHTPNPVSPGNSQGTPVEDQMDESNIVANEVVEAETPKEEDEDEDEDEDEEVPQTLSVTGSRSRDGIHITSLIKGCLADSTSRQT